VPYRWQRCHPQTEIISVSHTKHLAPSKGPLAVQSGWCQQAAHGSGLITGGLHQPGVQLPVLLLLLLVQPAEQQLLVQHQPLLLLLLPGQCMLACTASKQPSERSCCSSGPSCSRHTGSCTLTPAAGLRGRDVAAAGVTTHSGHSQARQSPACRLQLLYQGHICGFI